jgi:type IV pilus assembly protein PilY1
MPAPSNRVETAMPVTQPTPIRSALAAFSVLTLAVGAALADPADIANVPPATAESSVRSNLMLILDDSSSMERDSMPDNVQGSGLCFGHASVNRIFYDPNSVYTVPPQPSGLPLTTPTWPNAFVDGYASSPSTRDLSTTPRWTAASDSNSTRDFYYVIAVSSGGTQVTCPDGRTYRLSRVTSLPTAQRENYLIWYSYYRTRLFTTRGAVGTVMSRIDATRFRVGLSAISDTGTDDASNKFLNVRDFDATSPADQKQAFFSRLYSISDGGQTLYTPLRPALEKVGKYFANRQVTGGALPSGRDPVQYSCQRNFALLTTDGYWNTTHETNYRSPYTPTRLDGSTAIGNVDNTTSNTPRPMLDDGRSQRGNWVTGGAGVANTLADIAMYFYAADLRTPDLGNCTGAVANENVCVNNVRSDGTDAASHQHLSLFTLGLGVAGRLAYRPDYDTATTGDFHAIRQGTLAWPNPNPSSTGSTVVERIDDLWHAAVNGRGRYYAADKPADIVDSLTAALQSIQSVSGAGAAAATSTLQPVTGDNAVFLGMYTTVLWEGNIKALTIDPGSGAVSTTPAWEAKTTLAAQVGVTTDSRNIHFFDASVANKLASFTFANLNSAGKGAYFQNVCSMAQPLSQCPEITALGATELANANSGTNLVNYLRGRKAFEDIAGNTDDARLFRGRNTPLGDLVNAAPVYVKKPPFRYGDAGYAEFAAANAGRTGVVYAAANDGMLHAFNAATGQELWAFVPSAVLPNLYRLADRNYATSHRYFVDGTPVVGDVFDGTSWRTILVGGLGGGGRSYYALDVTNPASPKALWEFSSGDDSDLGLAFGNPVIAKNKAGTWIVAFSSGYNNISPGSGNGFLFVRNAVTGAAIAKIPTYTSGTTPAGTTGTPSNLGKISPWVNGEANNTAQRFYGGDMLGNIWRIDFDDNIAPSGNETVLLARATTPSGDPQPITIRPQLTEMPNGGPKLVTIATGRLLGSSDVADNSVQSLYVFKDTLGAGAGVLRGNGEMVEQTLASVTVSGRNTRRVSSLNPVSWNSKLGWFVDFDLATGERVNVETIQVGNLLAVASNIPTSSVCSPGGQSWMTFFNIGSGDVSDAVYGDAMAAGMNVVKLATGLKLIRWSIHGEPDVQSPGTGLGSLLGDLRRISWRELVF